MATLAESISKTSYAGGGTATARCSLTWTYAQSNGNTATSISASKLFVSAISVTGTNTVAKNEAKSDVMSALNNAHTLKFDGKTVVSKSNLAAGTTYTVSGSASVNRTTTAQTKQVSTANANANITVPALQSWAVTYNANSGAGAPANQTKYYGINLTLQGGKPTKAGYTFKGWASSEANAKAGTVNYSPSQTYSGNAGLSLWAVWELTYSKPKITNFRVERCDANGNYDDDGGYAKATFNYEVFQTADTRYYGGNTTPYENNEVNTCVVTVGNETAAPTITDGIGIAIVGNGSFNADDAYNASVVMTDTQDVVADNTTTVNGVLAAVFFPMDYNRDATAVGFFMPAPDNEFALTTDTAIVVGKTYYTRSGSAEPYKYTVVINPVAQDIGTYYEMTADKSGAYFGKDILLNMPDYQTAGSTDKEIYDALVALGWDSDVIV